MIESIFGGVTPDQVNESNQVHAINYATLVLALTEKGLLTAEEINAARAKATHFVDEEFAKKRSAAAADFDQRHPGVRELFGKLLGNDSSS